MRCMILVSNRMGSVPIVECGNIILNHNEELIVPEEIGKRLLIQYQHKLIQASFVEKTSLAHGHWELKRHWPEDPKSKIRHDENLGKDKAMFKKPGIRRT